MLFRRLTGPVPTGSRHCGRQEGGVAKDIEDVLAGRDEDGFALPDVDAVDVGCAPQADDDDEGVAMEIYLLRYLYYHAMHHKVWAVDEL